MEELFYEKYFFDNRQSFASVIGNIFKSIFFAILVIILVSMIFGLRAFLVNGWSMQPVLDYKSVVIVNTNIDKTDLKVGDILSFTFIGQLNTHRIIKVIYKDGSYYERFVDGEDGKTKYRYVKDGNTIKVTTENEGSMQKGNAVSYQTQGDNVQDEDAPIELDRVVGVAVTINGAPIQIKGLGYFIEDLQKDKIFVILWLILCYVVLFVIPNPRKYVGYEP